jgi:archaetidylinositol phosphate synthase
MEILGNLKNSIRHYVLPFASRIPFSPDVITYLGLFVSFLAAFEFAKGYLLYGALFLILGGVLDVLDGAVARASGTTSAFGGVLDSVCDRYADAIVFAGLIYGFVNNTIQGTGFFIEGWIWCIFAMIGSYLVSYTRARAEAAGASKLDIGVAERSERIIILIIGALSGFLLQALALIAILTHITFIQRVMEAKQRL